MARVARTLGRVLALLFVLVFLALLGGAVLAVMAVERQPAVVRSDDLSALQLSRLRALLQDNDPRTLHEGEQRVLRLSAAELDLIAHYAARQLKHGAGRARLDAQGTLIEASLTLPGPAALNLGLRLQPDSAGSLQAKSLRIGPLHLPPALTDLLLRHALPLALQPLGLHQDYALLAATVRRLSQEADALVLEYTWHPQILARLSQVLLPEQEQARLLHYRTLLAQRLYAGSATLTETLALLSQEALRRAPGDTVVDEARAVLLVLALHANGKSPRHLLPTLGTWPKAPPHALSMSGREDTGQHFVTSAAIAAYAGHRWAEAIGLWKEEDDAREGSGFSFTDLAADRAGTRLGQALTRPAAARTLLQRLAARAPESDLAPVIADLAEFMPEAEFVRRFGGVGAPAYQRELDRIDRRIAALGLYRNVDLER